MPYQFWIFLHLVGVTAFFSNAISALFWKKRADRLREPRVVAHTFRSLAAADIWISLPAVLAIVVGGVGSAMAAELGILRTGWILWSIAAFIGSGIVNAAAAWPLQKRIATWTTESATADFDWNRYSVEAKRWSRWAHLSLACAAVAMVLMVVRPQLPGL